MAEAVQEPVPFGHFHDVELIANFVQQLCRITRVFGIILQVQTQVAKTVFQLSDQHQGLVKAVRAQQALFQILSAPDFYRNDSSHIAEVKAQLADVEKQLELAFTRWEDLESRDGG